MKKNSQNSDDLAKTYEENWKRALADYQNLEKRTKEQQLLMAKFATVALVEKILPWFDNLKLAAKHISDPGLEMIIKQLEDILESEGYNKIQAINQIFDPNKMECMDHVAGNKDCVVEVLVDGYELNGKVVRPVKVIVGSGESDNHTK